MPLRDSNKKFTILKATRENFHDIKRLMLEALEHDPKAFSVDFEEFAFNGEFWWEGYIGPFVNGESAIMYMVKHEEDVVGMAGLTFTYGARKNHVAHLVWVFVKKEFRGNGLAKKLLKEIFENMRPGILKISLQVVQDQKSAIKIYEELGFEKKGSLQKELKVNGELLDVIIMEKLVPQPVD